VPLDGSPDAAAAADRICPLFGRAVDVIVLHVFNPLTAPRFLDRPARDLELWGAEFIARHRPHPDARLAWRVGAPGDAIVAAVGAEHADLVVLSWSQDVSIGHAAAVREVLGRSRVPVMLVPVDRVPAAAGRSPNPAVRP
jgi:hypothetical protein